MHRQEANLVIFQNIILRCKIPLSNNVDFILRLADRCGVWILPPTCEFMLVFLIYFLYFEKSESRLMWSLRSLCVSEFTLLTFEYLKQFFWKLVYIYEVPERFRRAYFINVFHQYLWLYVCPAYHCYSLLFGLFIQPSPLNLRCCVVASGHFDLVFWLLK
jgi:hypothetical protein